MYISIDLGGTNTRVASSENLKEIIGVEKVPTEQNLAIEKKMIADSIKKLSLREKIKGICVGVPGFVDKKRKIFEKVVNIPSFSGLSYKELFDKSVDPDLIIAENDAALAGLAEAVMGAGKNYDVVAYVTLGTGVGGVKISGKKLDHLQNYSEPGHMIINTKGRYAKACGQHGCLESYVSGTAFREIYKVGPSECEDKKIWTDYAGKLSVGIINIIAVWGPDAVVLGGSISNKFEEYFKEPLLEKLSEHELFTIPPVIKSELGDNSGLHGGFLLLKQALGN